MVTTELLKERNMTISRYKQFELEWTRECARLNPTEENLLRLEIVEKSARLSKMEEK